MDTKKSSPRLPHGTYIPPHCRHYPRTESVHYKTTQKRQKLPKTCDSYVESTEPAYQHDPTTVTPAPTSPTRSSRKPPSQTTQVPSVHSPTHVQVSTPTSAEIEAFYATSYTQPSPVEYYIDDTSEEEDTDDLTPMELTITPIEILTTTYYQWL